MLRVDVYAFYLLMYAYITVLKRYSLKKEVVCVCALARVCVLCILV